jgi:predicted ester cyclase
MSTSELLRQWYEEVWNNANESFIDEKMHRKVIIHGLDPSGKTEGIDFFKTFYKNFRESFPTIHVQITPLVHDDEYATGYCHVTGRNNQGKEVTFNGLTVARFQNGKIVEGWNNFDFLKMYQQLGHILVSQIQD